MSLLALFASSVLLQTNPTPDHLAKLRSGEVLTSQERKPGAEGNFAVARVLIEAPPELVWQLIADCANYAKNMPRTLASEAVDVEVGEGFSSGTMKCKVTTDIPWPFPDLNSVAAVKLTVEPGRTWRRDWNLVSGDYDYMEGSWILEAMDEGKSTLATYRIRAKPKIALPQSMVRSAQVNAIPDMMRGLRNREWKK